MFMVICFAVTNCAQTNKQKVEIISCSIRALDKNTASILVKIYNPEQHSLIVGVTFMDTDKVELEYHQRSQSAFPEFYTQKGDTTIFKDTKYLPDDVCKRWMRSSVRIGIFIQ